MILWLQLDKQKLISILTGVITGTFSGLTGVGGGAILVPMIVGFLKLTQHRAHGTSLAVIIFVALSGAFSYAQQGFLADWPSWFLVIELALGSVVGVVIGAKVMMKMPARQLRRFFGLFILAVGIRMLIGSF